MVPTVSRHEVIMGPIVRRADQYPGGPSAELCDERDRVRAVNKGPVVRPKEPVAESRKESVGQAAPVECGAEAKIAGSEGTDGDTR